MALNDPLQAYYKRLAERVAARRRSKTLPKTPKGRQPKELERQYYGDLRAVLKAARGCVNDYLIPVLAGIVAENRLDTADWRHDDIAFTVKTAMEQVYVAFKRRFTSAEAETIAQRYASRGRNFTAAQIQKQAETVLGVQAISASPKIEQELKLAVVENVALITSIPEKYFADVQQQVFEHVRRGDNVQDLTEALAERYNISDNRAALIARDQTSKLNGVLTEIEHRQLGITSYIWRTATDARVRDTHAVLDGRTFSYDDPPVVRPDGTRGIPGYDYNCRCYAEPNFEDLLPKVDED